MCLIGLVLFGCVQEAGPRYFKEFDYTKYGGSYGPTWYVVGYDPEYFYFARHKGILSLGRECVIMKISKLKYPEEYAKVIQSYRFWHPVPISDLEHAIFKHIREQHPDQR